MRIEHRDETELALEAFFDDAEQRALSRSADHVPVWMAARPEASRGSIRRSGDTVVASFRDADGLRAFLDRFLPGKLRNGGEHALGLVAA